MPFVTLALKAIPSRTLRKRTYIADIAILPAHLGALDTLPIASTGQTLRRQERKFKVTEAMNTVLDDIQFPEANEKLHALLFHCQVTL